MIPDFPGLSVILWQNQGCSGEFFSEIALKQLKPFISSFTSLHNSSDECKRYTRLNLLKRSGNVFVQNPQRKNLKNVQSAPGFSFSGPSETYPKGMVLLSARVLNSCQVVSFNTSSGKLLQR